MPFHMARDQIEESLRTKMSSIKVLFYQFCLAIKISEEIFCLIPTEFSSANIFFLLVELSFLMFFMDKARMVQLQDAQKGAEVTSEATERELELEAQLVEARSIIQEQVPSYLFLDLVFSSYG